MIIIEPKCPFCGSSKLRYYAKQTKGAVKRYVGQIHCTECGARGPRAYSEPMDWRDRLTVSGEEDLFRRTKEAFDVRYTPEMLGVSAKQAKAIENFKLEAE